eukprot:TRINITY_DN1063_c0_g1_i1.p1 TRINITY_DN1063_c0_g1~~TRINITY_DN1063_c0_g1_i1.p1  ORF type:complete len:209 (+),score=43.96 TRINITY_DN1063_c0_g1_i1:267-893(+)
MPKKKAVTKKSTHPPVKGKPVTSKKQKGSAKPTTTNSKKNGAANNSNDKNDKKYGKGSMKHSILEIVASSTVLVGLPSLKKELIRSYGCTAGKSLNTRLNKALKELTAENRSDFGKIGGSYHAGVEGDAHIQHTHEEDEEANVREKIASGDYIDCPFCKEWVSVECFIDEDSIARGAEYLCSECSSTFWSHISDSYMRGHTHEYKYSR